MKSLFFGGTFSINQALREADRELFSSG